MLLKRRVSLNGVQLDELDERILITGIDEAAGKDSITAAGHAFGSGQRVVRKKRDTLDVTVKFALKIRNDDMNAREELLETVNGWAANGGILRLEKRDNRRLYVVLAQAPGSGDMFNWSNEFTLVFRAYAMPYWEDDTVSTFASGTKKEHAKNSGSFTMDVPGNTETVANITVQNYSGAVINNITVKVGSSQIAFTGLNLPGNGSLVIDHVHNEERFYFRARIGSTSVMAKRTGADDFYVSPGTKTVTFSADRAVIVTAGVRGRYI